MWELGSVNLFTQEPERQHTDYITNAKKGLGKNLLKILLKLVNLDFHEVWDYMSVLKDFGVLVIKLIDFTNKV